MIGSKAQGVYVNVRLYRARLYSKWVVHFCFIVQILEKAALEKNILTDLVDFCTIVGFEWKNYVF